MIEQIIQRKVKERSSARGELIFPCLPAMFDQYMQKLEGLLQVLDQTITPSEMAQLREMMHHHLSEGFQASPYSWLMIKYGSDEPEKGLLGQFQINMQAIVPPPEKKYDLWPETRKDPLFGAHPDAKLIDVVTQIKNPSEAPVLDIGAGTGRNSLPLARRGHSVDALELNPSFANQLSQLATHEGLPIMVTQADVLHQRLQLRSNFYQLAIASQLITDFKSVEQVRTLFTKVANGLQSGGYFLFNLFLTEDDYQPSQLMRELAVVHWSFLMTRLELQTALADLPLTIISDESAMAYEQTHLPESAWPPTAWYLNWASGQDVCPADGLSIMELRWILCQRV